ncbi:matrixin [Aneurinibacillus soli]|uniref:Matrixin n=1 Tax=Aneurinibacillus soli TaxID=1500254 RepID=A0A0U4WKB6_9BACL|nr:matrixin family metalloprotease [Aneurinibacillus soli]PYE63002.1 matrixin [Aneurinibacillus soli]BAU28939.1 Matrixin [Aneurinibacillus soli]
MKKTLFLIALITVMAFSSSSVFAYHLLGGKWASANPVTWYYDSYIGSNAKTAASAGATEWNSVAYSKVKFSNVSAGKLYITEVNDSTADYDGICNMSPNTYAGTYTSGTITFNKAKTTTYNISGALSSVATHEMGHALGLAHSDGKVIMNPYTFGTGSRYGDYKLTTPQSDDIAGIKILYP